MLEARNKNETWFKFEKLRCGIIDLVPEPAVLALASPYLAGTTSSSAIEFAHLQYQQNGFTSTLDILGESSTTAQQCDRAVYEYRQLLNRLYAHLLQVRLPQQQISVSLKPSTFSTTVPHLADADMSDAGMATQAELDDAYSRIESIAAHAQRLDINITIEAEEHHWTDFHLSTYFSLLQKGYRNLGTVLQSRLLRTEQDIKKFDENMRVRLVIGIYDEPAAIALTDKKKMKQRLVEYGRRLAERGTYVEFATHDVYFIEQFVREAVIPLHLDRQQFEFQFLKGVPRKTVQTELATGAYFLNLKERLPGSSDAKSHLAKLGSSGATVRLYVPFGATQAAAAYCKRRLKENPSIIVYGLKNLLHLQ